MATVSVGRRTRTTAVQTPLMVQTITPTRATWCLIGRDASDDVTRDHRCALLRGGQTYSFRTTVSLTRMSLLCEDPTAPDDPLPNGDGSAVLVNVVESVIPP